MCRTVLFDVVRQLDPAQRYLRIPESLEPQHRVTVRHPVMIADQFTMKLNREFSASCLDFYHKLVMTARRKLTNDLLSHQPRANRSLQHKHISDPTRRSSGQAP